MQRNFRTSTFVAVALIGIALSSFAAAATTELSASNGVQSHRCTDNQDVLISGSNGAFELSGPCGLVTVSGSNAAVTIALVREIVVTGDNNAVTWTESVSGAAPSVRVTGANSVVTKD